MRTLPSLVGLATLLAAAWAAGDSDGAASSANFADEIPVDIVDFTSASLFEALSNHTVVVEFFSDVCALCKGYEPEYAKTAAAYGAVNTTDLGVPPVVFGRVNVDQERKLAKTFGVHNVPFVTVLRHNKWYKWKNGEMEVKKPPRYDGFLGATATIEWLNQQTGMNAPLKPYVVELNSGSIAGTAGNPDMDVLVEFYASWCTHCREFAKYYFEVGAHFIDRDDVLIARVDADIHRDVAQRYNVSGFPSLQLFPKSYKQRGLNFRGEFKPQRIIDFVKGPRAFELEERVKDRLAEVPLSEPEPEGADDRPHDRMAQEMFNEAWQMAHEDHDWEGALELLLTIRETRWLRATGVGSSKQMWNLIDNCKFNVEQQALGRKVGEEAGFEYFEGNAARGKPEGEAAFGRGGTEVGEGGEGILPEDQWEDWRGGGSGQDPEGGEGGSEGSPGDGGGGGPDGGREEL